MKLLIIDPGHGGTDLGAQAFGYKEKDLNLVVAKRVAELLKEYSPDMTRTNDITLSLSQRGELIRNKYQYCLSIHFNAAPGDARGIETIHSVFSSKGKQLAENVAQNLKIVTGIPIRRTFFRLWGNKDYYYMNRETGSTCTVIVESLFLDSPEDIIRLNVESIAQGIAAGFKTFMNGQEPVNHNYKFKEVDGTRIYEIDPFNLTSVLVNDTAANLAKKYKNFFNGMFFIGDRVLCLLVVNGKKIAQPQSYDTYLKGTLIIYNDGRVEIKTLRDILDVSNIKLAFQGFNCNYEANGSTNMLESMRKEYWCYLENGKWNDYVYHKVCRRAGIGYNPESGKITIVSCVADVEGIRSELRKHGCTTKPRGKGDTLSVGLDSGDSFAETVGNKVIYGTSRILKNIITF